MQDCNIAQFLFHVFSISLKKLYNNSCGNRDNPPQIPPIIIHIALLGIYSIPSIKNGIANIPIIKTHPPFAINDNFFVSSGSLNGVALLFLCNYFLLLLTKSFLEIKIITVLYSAVI